MTSRQLKEARDSEESDGPDDLPEFENLKIDEFEAPPTSNELSTEKKQADASSFSATTEMTTDQAMKDAFFEFLFSVC